MARPVKEQMLKITYIFCRKSFKITPFRGLNGTGILLAIDFWRATELAKSFVLLQRSPGWVSDHR